MRAGGSRGKGSWPLADLCVQRGQGKQEEWSRWAEQRREALKHKPAISTSAHHITLTQASARLPRAQPGMLVAVHAGAGYHALRKEPLYKELMHRACGAAAAAMEAGEPPLRAVAAAIRVLEVRGGGATKIRLTG